MSSQSAACALVLLLGCTATSEPPTSGSGTASSAGPSSRAPDARARPATDAAGACSFKVTGAITDDESIAASAMSTYWDGQDPTVLPALQVDCDGNVVHVDFSASHRIRDAEKVAFGPQEIELGIPSSKMIAFVRVNGAGPAEGEGTLAITAFDANHVAATFDVTIAIITANDARPSRLRIVGSFDAPCTLAACRR